MVYHIGIDTMWKKYALHSIAPSTIATQTIIVAG